MIVYPMTKAELQIVRIAPAVVALGAVAMLGVLLIGSF